MQPMPGVWEVRLSDLEDVRAFDRMQAETDEPVPPTKATLTVSALAVETALPAASAELALNGSGATHDLTLTNRMAGFDGGVTSLAIGAARSERPSIRNGEQLQYDIDVPAGSALLLVRASAVSDATADLDLYLIDCTGKECRNPRTDSDPVGDEIVTVQHPAAGRWKVVVDGASVPSGSVSFAYLDVVFNQSFGGVSTADLPRERTHGEEWTTRTHTWLAGALPAGREPYPAVLLQGRLPGNAMFDVSIVELVTARKLTSTQQR
jgi:hypothetical protein